MSEGQADGGGDTGAAQWNYKPILLVSLSADILGAQLGEHNFTFGGKSIKSILMSFPVFHCLHFF